MNDDLMNGPLYVVPPVKRAFVLLRYIAAGNRCQNIQKAGIDTGLNRTTLIRLLQTLLDERILEKRADGYHLGIGLIGLAGDALFTHDIVEHARPVLEKLTQETQLSSHLGILDGSEIVYLLKATPNVHLASNVRVGKRFPSYATTIGRIVLGHMPPEEVREILINVVFEKYTSKTALSVEQLITQVNDDRILGLAWSHSNFEKGLGSCAAAVLDRYGKPVAGINVTGHESHFQTESPARTRIGELVTESARTLSAMLGGVRLQRNSEKKENAYG
ncbi:IclR family transcriptional regulator [Ochrobactrum sp. GPK 3]|uniref:IclR family transcriptional regulator n=1 Tax=Brucella sp. 22210 TaxID=3453892 RepID=UPI0031384D6A